MRIVYGISGEGSGHSSRAREMMTHLQEQGHVVKAVSYDRGYRNLKDDFNVFETEGLSIASVDNKVSIVRTFTENLARLGDGVRRLRELRHECFKGFRPDVVITDFEPMTAYLARHYDLPLVTIDNQHRMRYMRYERPAHLDGDARVTETVIRALVPKPDVSLVTTFWFGEVTNERTFLFPPILRREVLELEPTVGEHVLVYTTSDFASLVPLLASCPRERFVVYGAQDEGPSRGSGSPGNIEFRGFSRDGFLADLASSKAVVASAGFTLMTEAIHLEKPMLAFPMAGQFEQELNALLLEDAGLGRNGRERHPEVLGDFLYRLPDYRAALAARPKDDHRAIHSKLDELLADDARLARAASIGNDDVGGHLQLHTAEAARAGGVRQLLLGSSAALVTPPRVLRRGLFLGCNSATRITSRCCQHRRHESASPHPESPLNGVLRSILPRIVIVYLR